MYICVISLYKVFTLLIIVSPLHVVLCNDIDDVFMENPIYGKNT